MKFAKLHGLGNDFIIATADNAEGAGPSLALLAQRICGRHTGVGADGIIFFQPTVGDADADVSALIFNADGSRTEMSGNGTRCLAAYLIHSGERSGRTVRIRTVSGIKRFVLKHHKDMVYTFEGSMGEPVIEPRRVPVRLGSGGIPIVDFPLAVGPETVRVTVSSMGNPHCSTFWANIAEAPVETLGPMIERHDCFPNRTNVEFIQILDRHRIRVRFWERGVGPTRSSGTGSSAAAVAAMLNGLAESPVMVEVEMGSLAVHWQPPGDLLLTGPAEYIFNGDFPV